MSSERAKALSLYELPCPQGLGQGLASQVPRKCLLAGTEWTLQESHWRGEVAAPEAGVGALVKGSWSSAQGPHPVLTLPAASACTTQGPSAPLLACGLSRRPRLASRMLAEDTQQRAVHSDCSYPLLRCENRPRQACWARGDLWVRRGERSGLKEQTEQRPKGRSSLGGLQTVKGQRLQPSGRGRSQGSLRGWAMEGCVEHYKTWVLPLSETRSRGGHDLTWVLKGWL